MVEHIHNNMQNGKSVIRIAKGRIIKASAKLSKECGSFFVGMWGIRSVEM